MSIERTVRQAGAPPTRSVFRGWEGAGAYMNVVTSGPAGSTMIVSGLTLGLVSSRRTEPVTLRRTPGVVVLRRTPLPRSVVSAHCAIHAESTGIPTLSPVSGSQTALAISSTRPPPGRDQATRWPTVSTEYSQVALTPSQGSERACATTSTGPSRTLPIVSKRASTRPERKVSEESGRRVPVVSSTCAARGYRPNRIRVAASSPGPRGPPPSDCPPNSCATKPPASSDARP